MKPGRLRETKANDRAFEKAMVHSADLLGPTLSPVEAPSRPDSYLLFVLGRLVEEGAASFENEEFRHLIRQGVRLEYDKDLALRSRFIECLRRTKPDARGILRQVIGAIEDTDFPLDRIGAVVSHYSQHLFSVLAETEAKESPEQVTGAVNGLFESPGEPDVAAPAIELLDQVSRTDPGFGREVAQRALAYAVSEPLLPERLEEQACAALKSAWPAARSFMLFNLRKHVHEDIPFRWLELLIDVDELRAVERVLEEVLWHASDPSYREDLLVSLDLIGRSRDPGRTGKVLRLMSGPDAPPGARELLKAWADTSPTAAFLGTAHEEARDFVHLHQDLSSFAAGLPDESMGDVLRRWDNAYHESLGWQRPATMRRSRLERDLEDEIRSTMLRQIPARRPDEPTLRQLVESVREDKLRQPRGGRIPLVEIYRQRPRNDTWLRDVCFREINHLYIRAAQAWDSGDDHDARAWLDLLEEVEPGYPLASALRRIIGFQKSLQDLK